MRNICSILFILFPLHWRGVWVFFDLFLISSLNNKYTTLVLPAHMGLMQDLAERIQRYHSHGYLSFVFMGTSGSITGREKTKGSWKYPWRHVMATYICKPKWELCAPQVLHPHIFYRLSDESVDRTTADSSPLWGHSPLALLTSPALAHTKEDTASPSQKWKVISACWSHSSTGNIRSVTLGQFQHPEKWRQYTAVTTKTIWI